MNHWSGLLLGAALVLYAAGVFVSISALLLRRRDWVFLIPVFTIIGFVIHFAGIVARGVEAGRMPLTNLRETLFLLAWVTISFYLLAHLKLRLEVLGVVILPLVVALMLVTLLVPEGIEKVPEGFRGSVRLIHIIPAVLGVAALFLTFASSLIYLVQERAIKTHRLLKTSLALPSLERCERLAHQSLTWGFGLLTFVVISGVISAGGRPGQEWQLVWHEKWALVAWLIFAAVMYDRIFSGGWRGRKAAYWSIVGFGAMILRMIGA
ncbi:MAG TPA: cytochrome c biogenesis protein CcsA [Candidatus Polarisedimenticolia bacterium]|nr:cytochrome c biogenesis protein CcsA [Candidatus Polarisedimenticolia bacterium]